MAIRFYEDCCDTSFQSLLQVVRSTLRGVDRLGIMDGSTLVIGMPSLDQEMAVQQARQICRGAEAVGLRWGEVGVRPFCIGIVSMQGEEPFRVAVSRAARLADQGAESYSEPVWVEQLHSAASV